MKYARVPVSEQVMISEQELGRRIASRPDRFDGEAYVVAAEVPVDDVLRMLAQGHQPPEVYSRYPGIDRNDLIACLQFTANQLKAALATLQSHRGSEPSGVDWQALQSRHGVSDQFLDAARQVFEQHDEILRRLA
jgi:uncharacterized protein (DUF433 family)